MVEKRKIPVRTMVLVSILSTISFILSYFEISLPIFPFFLQLDVSDVPALLASLMFTPFVGVLVELIKNLLSMFFKPVAFGLGQFANFAAGCALLFPLCFVCAGDFYMFERKIPSKVDLKKYLIGSFVGIIIMTAMMCAMNYFLLLRLYETIYHLDVAEICATLNSKATTIERAIVIFFVPFNLLKGVILCVLTYALYQILRRHLKH